jgi:hypothetical protein
MNFIKKSFVIILTLVAFSATAQIGISPQPNEPPPQASTDCISQKDIQDIAGHFSQFSNLTGKDFCNDNSQIWHLLSSMMFMKRTPFDANMIKSNDDLFSGKFASDWFGYFIGRIDNIDVVDSCPNGVVAYVYGYGSTMYVCPAALTNSFSSLDRASVFMHEARHIDGFPHVTCSKGPRAGIQGACDTKISDGGSYAVTVETYAQLAKYAQGLNPALKAYAKASSVIYADEAFEKTVQINRTEQLMLLTESLDFNVFTPGVNKVDLLGKAPAAGRIFKRAQYMVLIPSDKTLNARYVFARNEGEVSQSAGDMMSEYNGQTTAQKANLVDVHNGGVFTARVYKNSIKFTCDRNSAAARDVDLPAGVVAKSLLYPNGYDRSAMSANMISENGDIYDIGCQRTTPYVKASALRFDQKYSRMYKVAGQNYGLNAAGDLFVVDTNTSTSLNLGLKIIEIAPFQSYEFFD